MRKAALTIIIAAMLSLLAGAAILYEEGKQAEYQQALDPLNR